MTIVADIGLGLAIVLNLAFIVLFVRRSDWRSPLGLQLLVFPTVLAILMGLRFWARVFGPLSEIFWAVGFGMLDVVLVWRVSLLFGRRRDSENAGGVSE